MSRPSTVEGDYEISFESFGVHLAVSASRPDVMDEVRALLPPGWKPCPASAVTRRFAVTLDDQGMYGIRRDEEIRTQNLDLDLALGMLDSELRVHIGKAAPDHIFVHAGVVAHRGRTIVLPGMSFAGKTTLVAALVRAGAVYYSDEFAVLDKRGLVHPYAKPLSLRDADGVQTDHDVTSLGGVAGVEPLRVDTIVVTSYRPDARWEPQRRSAGEGVLALLVNTLPARERPAEALHTLTRAAAGAVVIESDRGEADALAGRLLDEL
ncbi:MAG: hypothetical protein QOE31_334 [Solirubrobacteraceae bacterium]|nr:hypothetical protein [Solirubrobacteraceae bacterium]